MVKRHMSSRPHGVMFKPMANERGRAASAKTHRSGDTRASEQFDWDAAFLRFAQTMKSRGYKLSPEQQKRIDDHG
jgi:hypothetical protein